jgi:hypothetical protein
MMENFTFQAPTTVGRRTFVVERASGSGVSSSGTLREPGGRIPLLRWTYRTKGHLGEVIQLDAGACGDADETEDQVQRQVVRAFDQYIQQRPTYR